MLQVVDYSWARPTPQSIHDAGYFGAIRYLSPDPSKNLSPAERDALWAAGLAVGLVWESTAARPAGGWGAGVEDAQRANDQADWLAWPGDRPLYYAVDYDTGPEGAVTDYFNGANSVGRRPVGAYGSYRVIEGLVGGGTLGWGWQCAAWSGDGWGTGGSIEGRRVSIHARIYQRATPVMGGQCDANDVLQPDWGGWAPAPDPEVMQAIRAQIDAAMTQTLREGDTGNAVGWAQILLNKKLGAVLEVDGIFGPRTTWAVLAFQLNCQRYFSDPAIVVDGVIGPGTWYYLTQG
jgi:hypothetical protein